MATSELLYIDGNGNLVVTDGTTTTQLATSSSSPPFQPDPIYFNTSALALGTTVYFTMADSTNTTSAIWSYNGSAVTQITSSSHYVYNQPDSNNSVAPQPLGTYNGDLVFSQGTLAGNTDGNFDTATLAIYNGSSIIQPSSPNGGYDPHDFVTLNGTLYFEATDSTTNAQAIYAYNGTTITEQYNNTANTNAPTGPLVAYNGHLYYGSGSSSLDELAPSGSSLGATSTTIVTEDANNPFLSANNLIVANNQLYFLSSSMGVFSINTNNSVSQVVSSIGAQGFTPVIYNSELYFVSYALSGNNLVPNLYATNGGANTEISGNFSGENFVVAGSTLYFDNNSGTTLGTINGTTVSTLTVPSGTGGAQLLVAIPFAATSWGTQTISPPSVTAGATASFTGGGSSVVLDSGLLVSDASSPTLASGTVSITSGFVPGDTLIFVNTSATTYGNIVASYDAATGMLTLTSAGATATLTQWQAALDSVTYSFGPTNGDPTAGGSDRSRTVSWTVNDGTNSSSAATSTLDVIQPPAVSAVSVPSNGTYSTGQKLTFVVNFDKNVTVNTTGGVPGLALSFTQGGTVQATYVSGGGTSSLTFQYTIIPGELDTAGIGLGSSIALNGGTIQDTFGNSANLTLASVASTTGVVVDSVAPIVSSPTVAVAEDAPATSLGIQAPTDPNYGASQLTIMVGALPTNGTVTLADGTTAVTVGETLTATQLTGLEFTPTAGVFGQSSSFTYTVTDPANNRSTGSATLNIGPRTIIPPPVITTAPELTNNATPVISGSGTVGGTITVFDGTTVVGTTTTDATGNFTTALSGDLVPGQSAITATETVGGLTSAASAPVGMFEVQAPVNGISTTDFSSVELGTALAQGYEPSFISGTEAITLVDGTISVGPDSQEATIQRLYEGLLGRPGEASGLAAYDQALSNGTSKAQVASIFLSSPEYTDAHGTMTNAQFVNSLYQGFLGRAPDPSGGAAFTSALDSGAATRAQTVIDIADSPEAKAHLAGTTSFVWVPSPTGAEVNELYKTALGRNVDVGADVAIQAELNAGTPFLQIVQNVVASPEYQADHLGQTNTQLVASLYENGLGRAPDQAGGQAWVNFLNSGASQAQAVMGIATSAEASAHLTYNLGGVLV